MKAPVLAIALEDVQDAQAVVLEVVQVVVQAVVQAVVLAALVVRVPVPGQVHEDSIAVIIHQFIKL